MNSCRIVSCDLVISSSEGGKRPEIYRRISAHYGEHVMTQEKKVYLQITLLDTPEVFGTQI